MYPVFNHGKGHIHLINILIASLVHYFVIYIEYIMGNYFAIWHNSDHVKHSVFFLASFQTLGFLRELFVNSLKHLTRLQSWSSSTKFATSSILGGHSVVLIWYQLPLGYFGNNTHLLSLEKVAPDPGCTQAVLNS